MNSLGIELAGKTVVVKSGTFADAFKHLEGMPFKCIDGFGCNSYTSGRAVFGMFLNGVEGRIEGPDIEKVVPDNPVLNLMVETSTLAKKEFDDQKRKEAHDRGETRWSIDFTMRNGYVQKRIADELAAHNWTQLTCGHWVELQPDGGEGLCACSELEREAPE